MKDWSTGSTYEPALGGRFVDCRDAEAALGFVAPPAPFGPRIGRRVRGISLAGRM